MTNDEPAAKTRHHGKIDLTEGKIWVTIVKFSIPILLSYLLQTFYSIADAAICGYTLSAEEVAGVNDTGSISFLFLQFAFGCTAGMSVLIANSIGKKDPADTRKAFATLILLGFLIIAVVTCIGLFTVDPLLRLLGVTPSDSAVNDAVYNAAHTYISVICGGMIGQYFYNMICSVLRSVGDSVTPLVFLAVSTVLNITLDLLFILGFRWGVAGAAAATVVSQCISALGCFIFTFIRYKELRLRFADFKAIRLRYAVRSLWQGVPLGLQFSVLAFGIITMSNGVIAFDKSPTGVMAAGTPAQIGYSAACKLDSILATPFNALGTAMLSFCGQNHGAGRYDRVKRGVTQALCIMLVLTAFDITAGLLLSIGGAYQHIFLAADKITAETIRYGNVYLYAALPCFGFLGGIFVLRNAVQGLEKPLYPFLAGIAELAARIGICLLLPSLVNGGPIDSSSGTLTYFCLCLADPGAWIAADILLGIAAVRYVYKRKPKTVQSPVAIAADAPASDICVPQDAEPLTAATTESEPEPFTTDAAPLTNEPSSNTDESADAVNEPDTAENA